MAQMNPPLATVTHTQSAEVPNNQFEFAALRQRIQLKIATCKLFEVLNFHSLAEVSSYRHIHLFITFSLYKQI